MIFLDTWIWNEFAFKGAKWERAEEAIETARDEGGIIAATVIMEVRYTVRHKADEETADRIVSAIDGFEEIDVVPVTAEVALYAADLREKYYQRGERELSYADAIHLAIAVMTDCEALYSGDDDFEGLEEIETVIL